MGTDRSPADRERHLLIAEMCLQANEKGERPIEWVSATMMEAALTVAEAALARREGLPWNDRGVPPRSGPYVVRVRHPGAEKPAYYSTFWDTNLGWANIPGNPIREAWLELEPPPAAIRAREAEEGK